MIFQVDFNREDNDELLIELGCKKGDFFNHPIYQIELNDYKQLEVLINKLDKLTGFYWSAVISFDPNTIYFDKDV